LKGSAVDVIIEHPLRINRSYVHFAGLSVSRRRNRYALLPVRRSDARPPNPGRPESVLGGYI